ncbi:MAG: L,D-transpeptidase family protein [Beijerinckiaceae bacterium]
MSQPGLLHLGLALALLSGVAGPALAQAARPSPPSSPMQPLPAALAGKPSASADAFRPEESRDAEPLFGPESLARTQAGLRHYEEIVAQGGWRKVPEAARGLKQGMSGTHVLALKERLAVSGDLDNANAVSPDFDAATTAALKRFQSRHGLSETGSVGKLTFAALNVAADVRLKQIRATIDRLQNNVFRFEKRYVVVNIPGAVVEAVSNGRVERRHLAVVGKKERQSPVISARISSVNLNPHWTVPNSIIKNDVAKALKTDPAYLNKNNLRTLNHQGEEVDPNTVNWSFRTAPGFLLRQDPGPQNSLGQLKIDMPNTEAVYMHDTPKKELFARDVRFHSSGCARISDVRDLAAWLLQDQGIDRAQIDRDIEAGLRTEIRLKRHVPVAWVYLTGYADGEGRMQFREDIYGLDTPEGVALTTLDGKKRVRPKPEAPALVAAKPRRPAAQAQVAGGPPSTIDPVVTGATQRTAPRRARPASAADAEPVAQPVPPPLPPRAMPIAQR